MDKILLLIDDLAPEWGVSNRRMRDLIDEHGIPVLRDASGQPLKPVRIYSRTYHAWLAAHADIIEKHRETESA